MYSKWLLILVVPLLAGAEQQATDAQKLQGTWTVEAAEKQGKKEPKEKLKSLRVVIQGDNIQIKEGDNVVEEHAFKLDPSKKPKAIDFYDDPKDQPALGIYELEGETLKLCWNNKGRKRPTEFATKPEQQQPVLMILMREKK